MMTKVTWWKLLIGWAVILAGVLWICAKMAMAWEQDISFEGWQSNLAETISRPFEISSNAMTSVFMWLGVIVWLLLLAGTLSSAGKWRRGAEHGSADWGNINKLRNTYMRIEGDDFIDNP